MRIVTNKHTHKTERSKEGAKTNNLNKTFFSLNSNGVVHNVNDDTKAEQRINLHPENIFFMTNCT